MTILSRYITKEILKYFSIVLAAVVGIYIVVDFIEKVDDFLEAGIPTIRMVTFLFYKTPFIIAQIMPVGLLLSVLVVFGLMSKNNEVAVLKSSGISVYLLLKPAAIVGVIFSVALFAISEFVVPAAMVKSNKIWLQDVRKKNLVSTREHDIWMKSPGKIIHIDHYKPEIQTIYGVTVNYFDPDFRLIRRVDAQKGVYEKNGWTLFDLLDQKLDKKNDKFDAATKDRLFLSLSLLPEDLKKVVVKPEEMGMADLYRFIQKMEREGYVASRFRVDFYAKTALPLVCVIMSLLGTGLAVKGKLKEGLPVSITYGLCIAFLYWIFFSFCLSVGYGEMLPPIIAAWMANLVFICIGAIVLINAE